MSYIAYLMVAIYLSNNYKQRSEDSQGEQNFTEQTYTKIFEYDTQVRTADQEDETPYQKLQKK